MDGFSIRHLNEIRIRGLLVKDLEGDTVLYTKEAIAHISPLNMIHGEMRINTFVLSEPDIRISRASKDTPLNIQFIIDNLDNGDKSNNEKNISLRINQFIAYGGRFSYNVDNVAEENSYFDKNHIAISDFACNVSVKKLNKEEADITIRSISGQEKSGFKLKKLRVKANLKKNGCTLTNMELQLPESRLTSKSLTIKDDSLSPGIPAITGDITGERLSFNDIKPFINTRGIVFPDIEFKVSGNLGSHSTKADISLNTADKEMSLRTGLSIESIYDSVNRKFSIDLKEGFVSENGFNKLEQFIKEEHLAVLKRLGNSRITGKAEFTPSILACKATLNSQSGEMDVNLSSDNNGYYSMDIIGKGIRLDKISGIHELDSCDMEVRINRDRKKWGENTEIGGNITGLTANSYRYAPIDFTTSIDKERIKMHVSTLDPNITGTMAISYRPNKDEKLSFGLKIDSIKPDKLNLLDTPEKTFSFTMNGEYNDYGNSHTLTNARINNLRVKSDTGGEEIRNIHISDNNSREQHMLIINSDIMNCNIIGDFEYTTLPRSLNNILAQHLPYTGIKKENAADNNYVFRFNIKQTGMLNSFLNIPIIINEASAIEGECNDKTGTLIFNGKINNAIIANNIYRSIDIKGNSNKEKIAIDLNARKPIIKNQKTFNYNDTGNDVIVNINSTLTSRSISGRINWDNHKTLHAERGTLRMDADIQPDHNGKPFIAATIHPDTIVHNDSIWNIAAGRISGNLDKILIKDFRFHNKTQSLGIHGIAGKESKDTLHIDTKDIELATIFNFINFSAVRLSGNASGKAYITHTLDNPDIEGKFDINEFKINGNPMGTAKTDIGWDSNTGSILLDTRIKENEEISRVNGFLSESNDTIELKIEANRLNMGFLNRYLKSFVSDLKGYSNGVVFLRGSWRDIDLYGALSLKCKTRVNATNATYTVANDSVHFSRGTIFFDRAKLKDRNGNNGEMSGSINHNYLSQWTCDLQFMTDNMLVYDTQSFGNMPFYGSVTGSGTARLTSNKEGLFLKADIENGPNSSIIYNSGDTGGVRDNSFVTFTDSRKMSSGNIDSVTKNMETSSFLSRMNLDFLIDLNDGMQLKVYTNIKSDDYISLYGNGPIQAVYDEHDGFTMKGNLHVERGTYKFTVQDIFPKEFSISKGSTLHFNGDPFSAAINLNTKYLIPSVSLSDLSPEVTRRKSVKVNCLMNISGTLASPVLGFDIELPEGSEEEREILASAINTPEQKNMQFIYLLGIGKFYTYDYNTAASNNAGSSTAMESFISNTLSGQLNNMLGHIIDNNNWDISGNFSTSEKGWNSMEVEGMLAGRLLNNRLLINGNFGYRENPIASSNFVGDFEVQWLLTPKGGISLKAYSKTNDRYFSKTNLTTQGAGIIFRHDFNKWKWWRNDKKKEEKATLQQNQE